MLGYKCFNFSKLRGVKPKSVRRLFFIVLFMVAGLISASAQRGFVLQGNKEFETIKFDFVNNLIIVPVEVNGVQLTFIVDSGVNYPILFNLTANDSLQLFNYEEIVLKGLGDGDPVKAIRSSDNTLKIGNLVNRSQELFLIMDRDINFSSRLGMEIHGIIGYDLFHNFVVDVNYDRGRMRFYPPEKFKAKNCRNCESIPMEVINQKAYVSAYVDLQGQQNIPVFLLVDTGSTDALWLFEDPDQRIAVPEKNFDDFMGRGLSGSIFGKRARVDRFVLGGFELEEAKVAFPDSVSMQHLPEYGQRNGSLGSEVLKRFNLVINYPEEKMYLRKSGFFKDPFKYNMSGIELQHNGLRVVREIAGNFINGVNVQQREDGGVSFVLDRPTYQIELHPSFEISELRENSPAREAGLQEGDVVLTVNGKSTHLFSLQELNELLNEREGKKLTLLIDRKGKELKFSFELKKVL